ncbi:hypothetical protein ACJZ2D_007942 [Fusarium nematophilum]
MGPATPKGGFRHGVRERFRRLRRDFCIPSDGGSVQHENTQEPDLGPNTASVPQNATSTPGSLLSGQANGAAEAQDQIEQGTPPVNDIDRGFVPAGSTVGDDMGSSLVSSDLWNAAYCEAVESLGEDEDIAILKGSNVA